MIVVMGHEGFVPGHGGGLHRGGQGGALLLGDEAVHIGGDPEGAEAVQAVVGHSAHLGKPGQGLFHNGTDLLGEDPPAQDAVASRQVHHLAAVAGDHRQVDAGQQLGEDPDGRWRPAGGHGEESAPGHMAADGLQILL